MNRDKSHIQLVRLREVVLLGVVPGHQWIPSERVCVVRRMRRRPQQWMMLLAEVCTLLEPTGSHPGEHSSRRIHSVSVVNWVQFVKVVTAKVVVWVYATWHYAKVRRMDWSWCDAAVLLPSPMSFPRPLALCFRAIASCHDKLEGASDLLHRLCHLGVFVVGCDPSAWHPIGIDS